MDIEEISFNDIRVQEHATYFITHNDKIVEIFIPVYQNMGKNCKWINIGLNGEISPIYESAKELTTFLHSVSPYSFENKLYEVYYQGSERQISFTLNNRTALESALKTHSTLKGRKTTATKKPVRKTVRKPATRKVKRV